MNESARNRDWYPPREAASDALDFFVSALVDEIDDYGPLARLGVHLEHLADDRLERIARLAYELVDLLGTSVDTHQTTEHLSYLVRKYGTGELQRLRADGCEACRASAPRWRRGVCRVCSAPALRADAYFCSESHRLQDARAGYP